MRHPPGEDIFLKWKERFGPIFTFWLGETPIICIAEYNKIVEYYQRGGEAFAGRHAIGFKSFLYTNQDIEKTIGVPIFNRATRPPLESVDNRDQSDPDPVWIFLDPDPEAYERIIRGGIYGVLQTEGEIWREHRRFVLHVFRDFGVGKNIMQERILTEISEMFKLLDLEINEQQKLNKDNSIEIDIVKHLERAISSIINVLLVGFRFDEEDAYNLVKNTHKCFFGFFQQQIDKHLEELMLNKEKLNNSSILPPPSDFMEAFLREKFRCDQSEENGREDVFSYEHLKAILFDLWISGQETTTTALSWGIALLLHNPSVMEKVQEELDNKFGNEEEMISWSDRSSLPYTCAVVNEILRVGNVVAQDFPHRLMKDTKVDKWLLRKGQPILAQISVVLIDPDIFSDPKSFRPERFLDENGNLLKSDHLIPFGLGKRQCLGESLARMELFLFFANIFNRYMEN
uniref:Cytochrome P450 n=1 Tax=Meloidogyne javanica TaxID=6303 RepID=A0A915M6G1_MELJA